MDLRAGRSRPRPGLLNRLIDVINGGHGPPELGQFDSLAARTASELQRPPAAEPGRDLNEFCRGRVELPWLESPTGKATRIPRARRTYGPILLTMPEPCG